MTKKNYQLTKGEVSQEVIQQLVEENEKSYASHMLAIDELKASTEEEWEKIRRDLKIVGIEGEIDKNKIVGLSKKQKEELAKYHNEKGAEVNADEYYRQLYTCYEGVRQMEQKTKEVIANTELIKGRLEHLKSLI